MTIVCLGGICGGREVVDEAGVEGAGRVNKGCRVTLAFGEATSVR